MAAAQEAEPLVGEGLRSHGHPVDGEVAKQRTELRRYVVWIALDGNLHLLPGRREHIAYITEYLAEVVR